MENSSIRPRSPSPTRRVTRHRDERDVIEVPGDLPAETKELIDLVATYVARGGMPLEFDIARIQAGNPAFNFITAPISNPANVYYRWKLYSVLQGDGLRWRTDPYQVLSDSNRWWIPPPLATSSTAKFVVTNTQMYDSAIKEGLNPDPLPPAQREEWFGMLSNIHEPNRDIICDAMVFALDHSVYAFDILDSVVESIGFFRNVDLIRDLVQAGLSNPEQLATEAETKTLTTTVQRMISRCFLLSDILCNGFATVHGDSASPRSIIKAADFILPRFFEEFMCFVILVGGEKDGPRTEWDRLVLDAGSCLWHLVSWVRELWANWKTRGAVSPHLTRMIEGQYSFILEA